MLTKKTITHTEEISDLYGGNTIKNVEIQPS